MKRDNSSRSGAFPPLRARAKRKTEKGGRNFRQKYISYNALLVFRISLYFFFILYSTSFLYTQAAGFFVYLNIVNSVLYAK